MCPAENALSNAYIVHTMNFNLLHECINCKTYGGPPTPFLILDLGAGGWGFRAWRLGLGL